jgi:hypothetical protein
MGSFDIHFGPNGRHATPHHDDNHHLTPTELHHIPTNIVPRWRAWRFVRIVIGFFVAGFGLADMLLRIFHNLPV